MKLFQRKMRNVFCSSVLLMSLLAAEICTAQENELTIGSAAPPLQIEHWISKSPHSQSKELEFETGKVYVVEFWATWCGPCIASMPELAALQKKHSFKKVEIISVTDEDMETVNQFLERKSPSGKSYREVTAAYQLTSDPDSSTHDSYINAAGIETIPTAFIVGKTGLIEWFGYPSDLEETLDAVLDDSWDQDAFKAEMQSQLALQNMVSEAMELAQTGKIAEAIEMIQQASKSTDDPEAKEYFNSFLQMLSRFKPRKSAALDYYVLELPKLADKPSELADFARWLAKEISTDRELAPLADDTIIALKNAAVNSPADSARLWNSAAKLQVANNDLEGAIESQTQCVATTSNASKPRHQLYLDELTTAKAEIEADLRGALEIENLKNPN